MSPTDDKKSETSAWNDEAKAAFMAFKKKKRNLQSPGDVDNSSTSIKKPRRLDFNHARSNNRMVYRNQIVDKNRVLFSEQNDSFVSTENNIKNSTMSENYMSMDVSDLETDKTEVACEAIDINLALLREMIVKKEDPYLIFEKIVQQMADTQKNYNEKINKATADFARCAARQNDQLVSLENRIMKQIAKVHQRSEDRLNAIEFTQKCSVENNIVWLSFADSSEIENLRIKTKSELIREALKILSRMDIWNNGNRTIVDVFTQKISIKTDKGFENEMIMGIKFLNSFAARDVKRLAAQYAKMQFMSKNFDSIRYIVRDNWSSEIWKLLRVCYDLTRVNLVERALVSDAGIQVFYRKKLTDQNNIEEEKNLKTLIRTESDLDELRADVNDDGISIPTFQFYNSEYFKMNFEERNSYRISLKTQTATNSIQPKNNDTASNSAC